jgi:hypothetical protein
MINVEHILVEKLWRKSRLRYKFISIDERIILNLILKNRI